MVFFHPKVEICTKCFVVHRAEFVFEFAIWPDPVPGEMSNAIC